MSGCDVHFLISLISEDLEESFSMPRLLSLESPRRGHPTNFNAELETVLQNKLNKRENLPCLSASRTQYCLFFSLGMISRCSFKCIIYFMKLSTIFYDFYLVILVNEAEVTRRKHKIQGQVRTFSYKDFASEYCFLISSFCGSNLRANSASAVSYDQYTWPGR